MFTLTQLQELISEKIKSLNFDKEPKGLYEPISYTLVSGGKRIRPAMVLAACNMFSETIEPAIPVALAFEVFHNFTLLHDDIMDNSPVRRNQETVHVKWNSNTAILSGDAMMIEAYELLTELPADLLKDILKLFNKTALEVCEGQQYDMDFETKEIVSEEEYLKMIKLKTSVLIAAALKAGAICGGASDTDADLLYDFGLNIGLAFQIQDDLLDTYADTSEFGKKIGNDIITGKKTFLLITALEKADKKTSERLKLLISDKKISNKEKINSVIDIYNQLKIKELTGKKIKELHNKSFQLSEALSCDYKNKSLILEFSEMIMNRKK